MTVIESPSPRPPVVTVTFYLMLILGLLSLVGAAANPVLLIEAPFYLASAWGIYRERAWSAYGLALFTLLPACAVIAGKLFAGNSFANLRDLSLILGILLTLGIVVLLFLTGRAIEHRSGRRGMAWPWIAATLCITGFLTLFGLYIMPTGSMEDTLLVGDRIAVWRTHGAAPQRGELVTHIYPVNRKDIFTKRVVGIPGDRIRILNKQLFVNGAAVNEPYAIHKSSYVDSYRDNFPSEATVPLYPGAREMLTANVVNGEVVVPPGHYFVLGDNRDSSLDSRYWGFIAQSDIIGIPKFVYYSVDAGDAVAAKGQLEILRVRWNRIFRKVS